MGDLESFKKVFCDDKGKVLDEYDLPINWDGGDFFRTVQKHLTNYEKHCQDKLGEDHELTKGVESVTRQVLTILREYLHGFPSKAYAGTEKLMAELKEHWLGYELKSTLSLYRTAKVKENRVYDRERIFHVPYDKRAKMTTYRYSIPGYPGLYLSDSLELAREETDFFSINEKAIAAKFKYAWPWESRLLNFGDRPENILKRPMNLYEESQPDYTTSPDEFILWYPLLAACSYIRTDRETKFAPEYIVPQLLTQWLRAENLSDSTTLVGIRYFSCKTRRAVKLGCNYFFPSTGDPILQYDKDKDTVTEKPFCPQLNDAFKVTKPHFSLDYVEIEVMSKTLQLDEALSRVCTPSRESFQDCEHLTIPEFCHHIGYREFENCKSLKTVTVPNNILTIGDLAFSGCTAITTISIGKGVSYINNDAFKGCSAVEDIAISKENETYFAENGLIMEKAGESRGRLVAAVIGSKETVDIPNSVMSIGDGAFGDCSSLERIDIPDSVTSIGDGAFLNCSSLACIDIPDSVTTIGKSAFLNCSSLSSIDNLGKVTTIEEHTFKGCSKLPNITIPDSVTSIGTAAFTECRSLSDITIPDSVTSIGGWAFESCSKLLDITIPSSVTIIGRWAFVDCSSLKEIHYLGSVSQFEDLNKYNRARIPTRVIIHCTDGDLIAQERSFTVVAPEPVTV